MQEFLHGAGVVCIYFVVAASAALWGRRLIQIPDELFRKMLHFILLLSYIPFAFAFETWWAPWSSRSIWCGAASGPSGRRPRDGESGRTAPLYAVRFGRADVPFPDPPFPDAKLDNAHDN